MQFPEYKASKSKNIHIDSLKKGLLFDNLQETQSVTLNSCKNLWYNQGLLRNRPGIVAAEDSVIDNGLYSRGFSHYYPSCDIKAVIEGESKQMVVEQIEYNDSQYVCLTHFINPDGSYFSTANMFFSRLSDTAFYMPQNILFYKGKPIQGGGIFALVSLVNIEDYTQTESRIYEITEDFTDWEMNTNYYIPTVYINGRGNGYEIAEASNQAYTEKPKMLEELNLLEGTFHAYYSTDSRSSSFQLPFTDLANSPVTVRFYYSLTDYVEWKTTSTKSSAKATYGDIEITMNVNRLKGRVYFTVPAGDYEIPMISHQNANNLRITATKKLDIGIWDVTNSTLCKTLGNKTVFANKNSLFCAQYDNPLYFPKGSAVVEGDKNNPFTALAVQPDRLLGFKEKETFEIKIEDGKLINTISLLNDNGVSFYAADKLLVKRLSSDVGCPDSYSVVEDDRRTFWKNKKGYIYSLSQSYKAVKCISENINSFIDGNFTDDFKTVGLRFKNHILFINEKNVLVCKIDGEHPASAEKTNFYCWKIPEQITVLNSFEIGNKPWLLCKSAERICYCATFEGDRDRVLIGDFYEPETMPLPIIVNFRTNKIALGCDNFKKKINKILLKLKTQEAKVSINSHKPIKITRYEDPDVFKTEQLVPINSPVLDLDIFLEAYGRFALGTMDISYSELSF